MQKFSICLANSFSYFIQVQDKEAINMILHAPKQGTSESIVINLLRLYNSIANFKSRCHDSCKSSMQCLQQINESSWIPSVKFCLGKILNDRKKMCPLSKS